MKINLGVSVVIGLAVIVALMSIAGFATWLEVELRPELNETDVESPILEVGEPIFTAQLLTMTDDECSKLPAMIDHRADNDPSYTLLRRLTAGDYAFAAAWAGLKVDDQFGCRAVKAGETYLDIAAIELKCGPAILQPQVVDQSQDPAKSILMFLHWPGAEAFPVPISPPVSQYAIGGFTNGDGNIGWGFGAGSQLTVGVGGPFTVWGSNSKPTDPVYIQGSDVLRDVGWFDNHCIFNPVFQIKTKTGDTTPLPSGGYTLVNFDEDNKQTGFIQFSVDTPPVPGTGRLGLFRDGVEVGTINWQDK